MPASKIYIIDELENLKGHCRERKQRQKSTAVHLSDTECSSIIAKKAAPKYVLRMMSSIDFTNFFGETNADEKDHSASGGSGIGLGQEEVEEEKHVRKCSANVPLSIAVEDTAKKFVSTIQSAEHVEHIADKLTCKKVDIEGLIRNKEVNESTFDRKFSVHEHIKLKNESPAFRYLAHYFGSGSSLRVPIGNEFPQTLKVAEGRKKEKNRKKRKTSETQNGMLFFFNPDFAFGDTCTITVTGTLPRPHSEQHLEPTHVTYSTTFWSNGDTNGLELTNRNNLSGDLSTFGGVVPGKAGLHRHKSMPGWNGRAPMWVPFTDECECTITPSISITHNNQDEREERGDGNEEEEREPQACSRLGVQTSHNSTLNFQSTFATGHDSTSPPLSLSCAEGSPYDSRRPTSSFGHQSALRMRGDGAVVYLTVFACKSPEVAVEKLTILSRKYERKATSGTTFHGDMPALNLACMHGNIIVGALL